MERLIDIGDSVRFQIASRAWQHQTYECDINPANQSVLSVRVRPAR